MGGRALFMLEKWMERKFNPWGRPEICLIAAASLAAPGRRYAGGAASNAGMRGVQLERGGH